MKISKKIINLVIDNNRILTILPFENLLMSNKVKTVNYNFEELVKEKKLQKPTQIIHEGIIETGLEETNEQDSTREIQKLSDSKLKIDSVVTLEYLKKINFSLPTPDIDKDTSQVVIKDKKLYSRGGTLANIGLSCEDEIRYKFMMLFYSLMPQNEGRKLLQVTKLKLIKEGNTPYLLFSFCISNIRIFGILCFY
jgi:hypothetical protein